MMFSAVGALVGPPISGAIYRAAGELEAVSYYAGECMFLRYIKFFRLVLLSSCFLLSFRHFVPSAFIVRQSELELPCLASHRAFFFGACRLGLGLGWLFRAIL